MVLAVFVHCYIEIFTTQKKKGRGETWRQSRSLIAEFYNYCKNRRMEEIKNSSNAREIINIT